MTDIPPHDLELVSEFCNYTDVPPFFTLPIVFCDSNIICERLLHPETIAIVLVVAAILVPAFLYLAWLDWMEHVADKLLDMTESEKMEYLLEYASRARREKEMQRSSLAGEVEQPVVVAQSADEKEVSTVAITSVEDRC